MKIIQFVFLFLLVSPAWGENYHAPQAAAEKALDRIFQERKRSNGDMNFFLLKRPGLQYGDYSKFFTPALLNAWALAGKKDVEEGCNGTYKGEICKIDFDVLTCAQDVPDVFLYKTIRTQKNSALVSYAWTEKAQGSAYYRMIKIKGAWKLDAVDCGDEYRFNAPFPLTAIDR